MVKNIIGQYSYTIAVTNRHLCERPYLDQVERICVRHPKALLVREKDMQEAEYISLLAQVQEICGQYDVLCIAHTFIRSALRNNLTAMHFPLPMLKEYQDRAYRFSLVGASVHSVEEAEVAERLGADYLTAGHIYATGCKPGLEPRGKDFLKDVCDSVKIPVYAIGGMTCSKACIDDMVSSGAAGICVMSECMRW